MDPDTNLRRIFADAVVHCEIVWSKFRCDSEEGLGRCSSLYLLGAAVGNQPPSPSPPALRHQGLSTSYTFLQHPGPNKMRESFHDSSRLAIGSRWGHGARRISTTVGVKQMVSPAEMPDLCLRTTPTETGWCIGFCGRRHGHGFRTISPKFDSVFAKGQTPRLHVMTNPDNCRLWTTPSSLTCDSPMLIMGFTLARR